MSKGIPQSIVAQISRDCRVYPSDRDSMRVSAHRLELFIAKRDANIIKEITAIRKGLAEQNSLIAVLKKYGKPRAAEAKEKE